MTAPWSAPPLWRGATAVLVAGGPSLMRAQVEACEGKCRVVAINDAYRLAPWADLLYFCDTRWWEWHRDRPEFRAFKGIKVTLSEDAAAQAGKRTPPDAIHWVKNTGVEGFDERRDCVRNGRNSGYQALHLAAHLGVTRAVLLGYDLKLAPDGREHWFGAHPGNNPLKQGTLDLMNQAFATLVGPLKARGIEVLNATPGSALKAFTLRPLADCLVDPA